MGAMVMFQMSDAHYETIYNVLSFSLASMMATTLFLWIRIPAIVPKYQSAVLISGMVTFIAAYHYIRIFNSWVDAYEYPRANAGQEYPDFRAQSYPDPKLTGVPFNDAYRYMDWLLTVPLLLIEIVLCMKLSPEESSSLPARALFNGGTTGPVPCASSVTLSRSWCSGSRRPPRRRRTLASRS